jgi:hypothetical protein
VQVWQPKGSYSGNKTNKRYNRGGINSAPQKENNMKRYSVKTAFVFEGFFYVQAESEEQARELVTEHCGLAIGSNVHSTLPDKEIDWNFCTHPEKEIKSVKQLKNKGRR